MIILLNYLLEDELSQRFEGLNRSLTLSLDDQIKFLKLEVTNGQEEKMDIFFKTKVVLTLIINISGTNVEELRLSQST